MRVSVARTNREMDEKFEQRAAVKFCVRLKKSFTETKKMVDAGFGEGVVSHTTVYTWYKRFKDGRTSLEDDERSGRPTTAVTDENETRVRALLKQDRHMSLRMLSDKLNISKNSVGMILKEKMHRRKVCSRFVPHFLTPEQKERRVDCCRDFVETCDADPNFLSSIVTGDESWCFQYDPLTKRQSSAWLSPGVPRPQKVRQQKSKVKTMLIAYFDAKGLIHHEYVPPNQTVNAAYYVEVLKRLRRRIQRVRPEYKQPGSWTLLDDNAPAHSANVVTRFLANYQIPRICHPPYSPDLAPADFFLFPKLKLNVKGRFFEDVSTIQASCTEHLKAITS